MKKFFLKNRFEPFKLRTISDAYLVSFLKWFSHTNRKNNWSKIEILFKYQNFITIKIFNFISFCNSVFVDRKTHYKLTDTEVKFPLKKVKFKK